MADNHLVLLHHILIQKNLWITFAVFIIGLTLHLADTTMIILVLSVAVISSWWQWHPEQPNAESQLILDTFKTYPAVIIRNYPHIVAFNAAPPCLAAAYQSSVPRSLLKPFIANLITQTQNIDLNISRVGLDEFLLLKTPLSSHTQIRKVFQTFNDIIMLLECQLQAQFYPAKRYQTICLFGLESSLNNLETSLDASSGHSLENRSDKRFFISEKREKMPFLFKS